MIRADEIIIILSVLFFVPNVPLQGYSVYLTCERVSCCWWLVVLQ